MELRDIQLGGFDAESDDRLDGDFIETEDVDVILDQRKFLILGRKGAGKSALFRQLPRLARERSSIDSVQRTVISLTPTDYEWHRLSSLEFPELPRQAILKSSWTISIYLAIADHLLSGDWRWLPFQDRRKRRLRNLVIRAIGSRSAGETPFQKAIRFFDSFDSAKANVAGVAEAGFERTKSPAVAGRLLDFERQLIEVVAEILVPNERLYVQFDRLDDVWDGKNETKSWLIGLLKSAKSFNDKHWAAESGRIAKVIAFLRTDIYETLRYDEKDKLRSFEKLISWSQDTLQSLVEKRLPGTDGLAAFFEPKAIDRNVFPVDYLFSRTFWRPREVLQFVQQAFEDSATGSRFVSNVSMKKSEGTFSNWKVDDLKLEYQKANPYLGELIEALRQGPHRFDSLDKIAQVLEDRAAAAFDAFGRAGSLSVLVDTSVIGLRLRASGKVRFKYNEPGLELPTEAAVYVHPGLHRGLLISEVRKKRGADARDEVD